MIGPTYFITSRHFQVESGEDEETNPSRYGKSFAAWVAAELRSHGESVEDILAEDFGWSVVVCSRPVRYWIACGNREGSDSEWGAYVVAEPTLVQRLFKRVNVKPEVARLSAVLRGLLVGAPGSSGVREE
jgi:hypothetical protein